VSGKYTAEQRTTTNRCGRAFHFPLTGQYAAHVFDSKVALIIDSQMSPSGAAMATMMPSHNVAPVRPWMHDTNNISAARTHSNSFRQ